MKAKIFLFSILIYSTHAFTQSLPQKKVYNPNTTFSDQKTLIVVNQKIYDVNSKEGKLALIALKQNDTSKTILIVKDFDSQTQIKQIIIIMDKPKSK